MAVTWTLGGVTLFAVNNVSIRTNANIVQFALPNVTPGTPADEAAQIFDTLGAASVISVQGVFAPNATKTAKEQYDDLTELINGNQDNITFSNGSVLFNDQSVMIAASNVTWDVPGNKSEYVLTLLKGLKA